MIEFKMPALGADMDEGTLNEWLVKPGDTVTRGQVVAVVETTKAAVEVECWHEGTVQELLVPIGETVQVGTPLATLLAPGEIGEAAPNSRNRPTEARGRRSPRRGGQHCRLRPRAQQPGSAPPVGLSRPRAACAASMGVDVDTVTGTGPRAPSPSSDVEHAAASRRRRRASQTPPRQTAQPRCASRSRRR